MLEDGPVGGEGCEVGGRLLEGVCGKLCGGLFESDIVAAGAGDEAGMLVVELLSRLHIAVAVGERRGCDEVDAVGDADVDVIVHPPADTRVFDDDGNIFLCEDVARVDVKTPAERMTSLPAAML